MDWGADAIERLRALWAEGHSTAEIGRRMGVTKNAVVGKAHRLQLPPRPSPIRRETADAPRAAAGARAIPALASPLRAPAPSVASFAAPAPPPKRELPSPSLPVAATAPLAAAPPRPVAAARPPVRPAARSCCWPIGEPGTPGFRFCTAEAMSPKPYCAEHAALAYVRVRDRREDAA